MSAKKLPVAHYNCRLERETGDLVAFTLLQFDSRSIDTLYTAPSWPTWSIAGAPAVRLGDGRFDKGRAYLHCLGTPDHAAITRDFWSGRQARLS